VREATGLEWAKPYAD